MSILSRFAPSVACWALAAALLAPASALALTEFQKLTAGDAMANDNFAYSVSISGSNAILGAYRDDQTGMLGHDAGSAYIFRNNGSGTWAQVDKLIASDFGMNHNFGAAVAIDGNTAAVGAILRGNTGGGYIFKDNGAGDWQQVDTLIPNDAQAGDQVGYSISLSGNTAIVGAWQQNSLRGTAYIFRDNGAGDWVQIGKLTADDGLAGERFGVSVAISGTTALVGASFDSHLGGPPAGAVYVFQESGGTWSQVDKLRASDSLINNQFGTSISLSGDTAAIGAPGDTAGGVGAGAAYIFRRDNTMEFQEVQKLVANDPNSNNQFGFSVGLSGGSAIVGAYQDSDGGLASGSAYFFQENANGQWNQTDKLLASDDAAGDAFGYSVAISGGVGLVGAPLSNAVGIDAGAAYLFNVPPGGIVGDYNQNGVVDAADYVLWRDTLNQTGPSLPADGNGDGTVNQADYDLWRANFGNGGAEGAAALRAAATPEPSAAVLLLLALNLLAASGRSRLS